MGFIGKIINQVIEDSIRKIVTEIYPDYTRMSNQICPPGIDAAPLEEDQGVSLVIDSANRTVNIGIYPDAQADPGEIRIYSRDENGDIQALIYCKNDGTIEINGSADYAVAFDDLKSAFDEFKDDMNNFITTIYNVHVHPGVTAGPASTSATVSQGTATAADMSDSKVDTVKLP